MIDVSDDGDIAQMSDHFGGAGVRRGCIIGTEPPSGALHAS
jgi:hypothetical protein